MVKYMVKVACLGLMLLMSGLTLMGEEWIIYGARAQGMGGAGVAVGDGATAPYWNPAALTLKDTKGLYIPVGTTISAEGDIIKYADAVVDAIDSMNWDGISTKIDTGDQLTLAETSQLLDLFVNDIPMMSEPGQGLLLNLTGGAIVTIGDIGISANFLGYAGIDPTVDLGTMSFSSDGDPTTRVNNLFEEGASDHTGTFTNPGSESLANIIDDIPGFDDATADELVFQAELAGVDTSDPVLAELVVAIAQATAGGSSTVSTNASGIIMSSIIVKEVGFSYGRPVMGDLLSIGGTIKMMQGDTYYKEIRFDDMEGGDDIAGDLGDKDNRKTSTSIGLDVGALLKLTDNLKAGLTGRNLNSPKFKYDGSGDYKLKPQFRLGASLKLTNMLLVAADYDVTKNKSTALDDYESQMFGAGAEINLIGFLKLRGGMYNNLASDEANSVYTFGFGIHMLAFDVDLAAAMSSDEVDIETGSGGSEKMRERYSFAFSMALRF